MRFSLFGPHGGRQVPAEHVQEEHGEYGVQGEVWRSAERLVLANQNWIKCASLEYSVGPEQ